MLSVAQNQKDFRPLSLKPTYIATPTTYLRYVWLISDHDEGFKESDDWNGGHHPRID